MCMYILFSCPPPRSSMLCVAWGKTGTASVSQMSAFPSRHIESFDSNPAESVKTHVGRRQSQIRLMAVWCDVVIFFSRQGYGPAKGGLLTVGVSPLWIAFGSDKPSPVHTLVETFGVHFQWNMRSFPLGSLSLLILSCFSPSNPRISCTQPA